MLRPAKISRLGLKEGVHIIAAQFYRGSEVIAPELTPEQRRNYYAAENKLSISSMVKSGASLPPETFYDPDAGQRRRVDGLLARNPRQHSLCAAWQANIQLIVIWLR